MQNRFFLVVRIESMRHNLVIIYGDEWVFLYILLMIVQTQAKANTETRGRPRKQETRTLSPIYKEKFSDNSAIMHTSFLIYVFEVFVETKNQKRVGHKDGGFTIYDKIDSQYCFDNIQDQLKLWKCQALLTNHNLKDFVKLLPALGPKVILKEISQLINYIVERDSEGQSEQAIFLQLTHKNNQQRLDEAYPYMRFVPLALHDLKMDKNDRSNSLLDLIAQRVHYLWEHLIRIITHTILNCVNGKVYNKYFKPFFSDAENPNETYIGQLNLAQVVQSVKRLQSQQRMNKDNEENLDDQNLEKPRKMKSFIDNDGTRAVVQIITAPVSLGQEKKNSECVGLALESPNRIVKIQSEPPMMEKGFGSIFQSTQGWRSFEKKEEQSQKTPQLKKQVVECEKIKRQQEEGEENGEQSIDSGSSQSPQSNQSDEGQLYEDENSQQK